MRKPITLLLLVLLPLVVFSQKTIVPGSAEVRTAYLKPIKSLYTVNYVKDTTWTKMGTLTLDISSSGDQLTLTNTYTEKDHKWVTKSTSVANGKTLMPISYDFEGTKSKIQLTFGETVTGIKQDLKTNTDTQLSFTPQKQYFDGNWLDLMFTTLPLDAGYKATLQQFSYYNDTQEVVTNYMIQEVKSYIHSSTKTGDHETWLVTVLEEVSGAIYYYIIDKKDHRLWQREMPEKDGFFEIWVNEELDYQPIKNTLNIETLTAQIKDGNSVIIGTAFAKADTGKVLRGLINTSKKQFAPKGTEITLFPNSAYYEEWTEVNKKIRKQNTMPEVPLVANFSDCIKKTTVYDDEGHFEFTNLMPGTYKVLASFDFVNSYNFSYVSGYTDYYNYYGYQGSSTNYGSARQYFGDKANIEKSVTIDSDGDKKEVVLKDN